MHVCILIAKHYIVVRNYKTLLRNIVFDLKICDSILL